MREGTERFQCGFCNALFMLVKDGADSVECPKCHAIQPKSAALLDDGKATDPKAPVKTDEAILAELQIAREAREREEAARRAAAEEERRRRSLLDFEIHDGRLQKYTGHANDVIIPDGVSVIGEGAFFEDLTLTSVVIPAGVESIEYHAFEHCENLLHVRLPEGLKKIGAKAFCWCKKLQEINLPDSLTEIEEEAFQGCSGLTGELNLPAGLKKLGKSAFYGCEKLTGEWTLPIGITSWIGTSTFTGCKRLTGELNIPNRFSVIGENAFRGCEGFTGLVIPDTVTQIRGSAFSGCIGLTHVSMGNGVTSIGNHAFQGCINLKGEFKIPDSVISIGRSAFDGCSGLTKVTIGSGVTEIGEEIFDGSEVEAVELSEKNVAFFAKDGIVYNKAKMEIACVPPKIKGAITIPAGVETIDWMVFDDCKDLTAINIPEQNKNYSSWDGIVYNKDRTVLVYCPRGKGGRVVLPNGVKTIGHSRMGKMVDTEHLYAFDGDAITEIVMPESLRTIYSEDLRGCSAIKRMTIPKGVNTIEDNFYIGQFECFIIESKHLSFSFGHFKGIPKRLIITKQLAGLFQRRIKDLFDLKYGLDVLKYEWYDENKKYE